MKTITIILTGATLALLISAAEQNPMPSPNTARPALGPSGRTADLPPFPSVGAMHDEFHRRFVASPGFGMMRVLRPIFLAPAPELTHNGTRYQVTPPDLIGLEDEAAVYGAREHSFRHGKTNAEPRELFRVRPMNAFESNAVARIRAGRDVVFADVAAKDPSPGANRGAELRVVGALRADASCAKCHQCDEGKLLGAFTYTLKPIGWPAVTPTNAPALSKL